MIQRLKSVHLVAVLAALAWVGCGEPEPVTRCVIDRVEVMETDPDYFEDTIDEGNPDVFVELRYADSQSIVFTSGVAQDATLPVNLDFVAVSIEEVDFDTEYEFTVFDHDEVTTQDFIALGLPFTVRGYVADERSEVDITDGATIIRVHLIWY